METLSVRWGPPMGGSHSRGFLSPGTCHHRSSRHPTRPYPLKTGNPKGKMLKMLLRTPSIIDIVYPFRMGERTSIMELLRFGEKGGSSAPSPHLPTRQPSSQQPQIFKVTRKLLTLVTDLRQSCVSCMQLR